MKPFDDMVDVCSGKMSLREGTDEVFRYMFHNQPKRLLVDIKLKLEGGVPGYYVTIWVPKKDFDEKF